MATFLNEQEYENLMEGYDEKTFYAMADESYDRMMKAFSSGVKEYKSYTHFCISKSNCKCKYNINVLGEDGIAYRKGTTKPILSEKEVKIYFIAIKTYSMVKDGEGIKKLWNTTKGKAVLEMFYNQNK